VEVKVEREEEGGESEGVDETGGGGGHHSSVFVPGFNTSLAASNAFTTAKYSGENVVAFTFVAENS
jgi:hypothetical protein